MEQKDSALGILVGTVVKASKPADAGRILLAVGISAPDLSEGTARTARETYIVNAPEDGDFPVGTRVLVTGTILSGRNGSGVCMRARIVSTLG